MGINLNNLDKSTWETHRFDEIAKTISERIEPSDSRIDRYIGLEHLGAESVHIRRFGSKTDVKGQKLKCYPGDIIFGKRRAYQRKAALVTEEAICSAHAFVLRANPAVIDPQLFPFFLHSDQFMDRAIDISVGGLSPTINWKTLKEQEFLLPPKDQQAQLAELLWAMDEVIEKDQKVLEKLNGAYDAHINSLFTPVHKDWEYVNLSKVSRINASSLSSKTDPDHTFRYLDISSIIAPKQLGELKWLKFSEAPSRARRELKDNSIVLSLVRPYQKSFVFIDHSEDMIASTGTGVVEVNSGINAKFIFHQFFSRRFLRFCENMMTGTNYPAITPNDLQKFKVSIPKQSEIIDIETEKLEKYDNSIMDFITNLDYATKLQKSLINQVFS